jgi:hypothetical protein
VSFDVRQINMSFANAIILRSFVINEIDAKREGLEIIELIKAHGADASNSQLIEKTIYKELCKRYEWKDLNKKREIENDRVLTKKNYNSYIDQKKQRA